MKTCTKCKQQYPATLEYFGPAKSTKDGFHTYCRFCRRIEARARVAKARDNPKDEANNEPKESIKRTELEPGRTLVQFGKGWKTSHPVVRISLGFESPLNKL